MSTQGRATVALFISQVSLALVNLPVTVLLAHELQPAGLGQYQYLARLALLTISVAHMGLPHALAWSAARARTAAEQSGVYRLGVRVPLVTGTVTAALWLLAKSLGAAADVPLAVWLCFALVPLVNMVAANVASCLRGTLDVRPMTAIRIGQALTSLTLIMALAFADRLTLASAAAVNVGSQATGAAIALFVTARLPRADTFARSELWAFSRRVWPGLTLRDWNLFLDQVVVRLALGLREVGLYAAAVSLSMGLTILVTPITSSVQPLVQAASSSERLRVSARAIAASVLLLGAPAACLALAAPLLLPLLYGQAFSGAVPTLQILCLATAIEAYNFCLHGILLGLGRPGLSSLSSLAGLALSAAGWLLLLPLLGIEGAAWSSVVAYVGVNVLMTRSLARALDTTAHGLLSACLSYARRPWMLWRDGPERSEDTLV